MTYRVGRTQYSPVAIVPNVSASGYDAGDAIGLPFVISAVGEPGGLLANLMLFDNGSGSGAIRAHFFSQSASASPHGTAWSLYSGDYDKYIGSVYVSAAAWNSGSGSAYFAQVMDQPLPLWSDPLPGNRTVWCQLQAVSNYSAFVASGLRIKLGVLQD